MRINPRNTFFILIALYLFTRLLNLTLLPMFTDESIYIYWAKTIATTHSQWFISLYDGKPPILIWIIAVLLSIFPHDMYLFAGRLPSVLGGLITLLGIYKLSYFLFKSKRTALLSFLLYVIFPFNLFYDRLALFDSLFTSMLVWTVYFSLKTAKTYSIKYAVLWGVSLGLGYLFKPPAILFAILTPICFVVYSWKELQWKKALFFSLVAVGIAEIMNNMQRISNSYQFMAIKNSQFQQPIAELLKNPLTLFPSNMMQFISWMLSYYTFPIFLLGCYSFYFLLKKNRMVGRILGILWIFPMIVLAFVGREIFPRYIVFVTPYFIISTANYIDTKLNTLKISKRKIATAAFALFFLQILLDFFILTNPPKAFLPKADYTQFISEHPSGYGLQPIFDFLDKESKNKKIIVVTQGTFGLYPYAFNLRYWDNKNITIIPRWPLTNMDQDIYDLHLHNTVYIVLKEHEFIPGHLLLKQIIKGEKPRGSKYPVYLTTFL